MDGFLEQEFTPDVVDALMTESRLFRPKAPRMTLGEPTQCRSNVARLVLSNPRRYTAWTGMSLCDDNMWPSHSWVIGDKGRVIETTVPHIAYYGYQMSQAEVEHLGGRRQR